METQFRPYTILASLASVTPSSIELRDTSGNSLECNYISVESSGTADSFFSVSYDAPGITTPLANQTTAPSLLGTTSGITGGIARSSGGVVEFLLSDNDRVSTIKISPSVATARTYFITYGQIQRGNPGRDNLRPIGS
jgi:hypothetical protein